MVEYKHQRHLLMTVDPVHVGTGGYRLGRVDLSIVREPGTNVPKIPGTSLSGAIRQYAASRYGSLRCAGQGQASAGAKGHCSDPTCPVCYTFGYLNDAGGETKSYAGVVNIADARLLLFPVHTMAGPMWVSTVERLGEAGFEVKGMDGGDPTPMEDHRFRPVGEERKVGSKLNLGWLMMDAGAQVGVKAPDEWKDVEAWKAIKGDVVLVRRKLFAQIVNSNLEVRTSVSIDPERGAAEEGALFTYEAIPRAAFFVSEVILDDYRAAFPNKDRLLGWLSQDGHELDEDEREHLKRAGWTDELAKEALAKMKALQGRWDASLDVVDRGMDLVAWLGVGGMGTRGFGRIKSVATLCESFEASEVTA
jgi:CRISPR-associated protein Cmr4